LIDDAELGSFLQHQSALVFGSRLPLARLGILDKALPVPDAPAHIELAVEGAIPALPAAFDGEVASRHRCRVYELPQLHPFALARALTTRGLELVRLSLQRLQLRLVIA
jgi:hypothetical protein